MPGRSGEESYGDNLIASAVSASAGHHGHSSPRGDGSDNLVAHSVKANTGHSHREDAETYVAIANPLGSNPKGVRLDLDNDTYIDTAYALAARNAKGVSLLESQDTFVLPQQGVRRLTPLECERLMGWPESQENVIIEVCGEQPKSPVPAVARSPRLPGRAGNAASADPPERALFVEPSFTGSSPTSGKPVEVHVVWSCEDGTIALTIPGGGSPLLVSSAEARRLFGRLGLDVDSALLAAVTTSTLARTIRSGRTASPTSGGSSSHLWNGEPCVRLSGDVIEERARGAASTIDAATKAMRLTTSAVGPSSPTFASMLETLCCCVAAAICGLIPELTPSTGSFALRLSLSSGWTRYDDQGNEIADSHRYRMCGNGVVATVAEWIGHRIVAVDRGWS